MLRIGIYPRKSVYRDNSDSVQVQITACKDYARLMFKDQKLDFRIYDKDEGDVYKRQISMCAFKPSTLLIPSTKYSKLELLVASNCLIFANRTSNFK